MNPFRRRLALLLCAAMLFAVPCFAEEGEMRILVVETTDIHGYIMDASSGNPATFQYRMPCIAHMIGELRDSGRYDGVILLDGGDLYQGTPVSNLTGGAAMRALVDRMGYDAVALGNHEFDWEVTEYAADSAGTVAPYALGDDFGDPDTPVLACNLYDARTGARVPFTRDYTIVEKAGKRVAVVGYIPDYRGSIMAARIAPYRIDDDLDKLDALVRRVNALERPDALIVLAHADPRSVARAMDPKEVALVAGGHTHQTVLGTAENGVPFMQGRCYGQGFASAELVFGPDGGVSVEDLQCNDILSNRKLLYDTQENAPHLDADLMALCRATWDAVSDQMSEVLGYIDAPILRPSGVGASSGGNWMTGLMLRATRSEGTVAAFYNASGIRVNLKIPKGAQTRAVTVYDVYSIAPFFNSLLVYELTGAELRQQLINGLIDPDYGDQMTGLTFTYTATGDADTDRARRKYTILSIALDDGTPVDPEDTKTLYRVCVSAYSATLPRSVFAGKTPVVPEAEAPVDNESMIRLLREEGLANGGHIAVDDGPRGIEVAAPEAMADAA